MPKSTLSEWLKNHPLSPKQVKELQIWSERRIEKYRETVQKRRELRLAHVYQEQQKLLSPLSEKDFLIAGYFLYAGEGAKSKNSVSLSNSNPVIIKFFVDWLIEICKIPKIKIGIKLQLYRDMDREQEISYWMEELDLPRENFKNPYFKKSSSERINYKGGFGHGTCNVRLGDVRLFEKIMMSIKLIEDELCARSSARLEQRTYKPQVLGSNPSARTITKAG